MEQTSASFFTSSLTNRVSLLSLSDKSTVDLVVGPFVRHALSSLLSLADSGSMEQDALCAPMAMGVKEPCAF